MTISAVSSAMYRAVRKAKKALKTNSKTTTCRSRTEHTRGTDGLTDAKRSIYALQAKSLHNSLPIKDLEKAFNRLATEKH